MQPHLRVARSALRAGCGLAEDRVPVLCASRCPSPSPDPRQPPLPFLPWKMVPAAGRGEWRPPSARGRGDGAGHLREGRAELGGRGVAEGVLTVGCPAPHSGFSRSGRSWRRRAGGLLQVVACRARTGDRKGERVPGSAP